MLRRSGSGLAQLVGGLGLLCSAALTLLLWGGLILTLSPAKAALSAAEQQLQALDLQLEATQQTLSRLDELRRPELVQAVSALRGLAQKVQGVGRRTVWLGLVVDPEALEQAVRVTRSWEAQLQEGLPLPALEQARHKVQGWHSALAQLEQQLTWLALALGGLLTLLIWWFGAGQWALWRLGKG